MGGGTGNVLIDTYGKYELNNSYSKGYAKGKDEIK